MKKMMLCLKTLYILVQTALIYYTFNKSHLNSFILLVFPRGEFQISYSIYIIFVSHIWKIVH